MDGSKHDLILLLAGFLTAIALQEIRLFFAVQKAFKRGKEEGQTLSLLEDIAKTLKEK